MPTPSEDTLPPPASVESAAPASNGFTSCPPEETREYHAPREQRSERSGSAQPSERAESAPRDIDEGDTQVTSELTTSDEDDGNGTNTTMASSTALSKAEHLEDTGMLAEPPSPTVGCPDAPSDSDARLAQSMSTAAISPSEVPSPQYLHFPELDWDRQISRNSVSSFLRPGSKFRGTQQSDRQVYDVQVEIKDVDLAESFLCGYLRIQGLTDDHPTLTTFFEGEIIGPKYLFKTAHPTWGSSEKVDLQHWARFPAWRPLAKSSKSPNFSLKNYLQREHLFMRWKEYFLVPDHRVKTITGASFEGFYYICFNQCSGNVSGIYFHAKSEKYQQLELQHVEDRGCMPAVEFR
ncbi:Hypothetical predicted protein [Lecanosticta acicola]|uniref:Vacuolar import and degradation protein n=1 Tax=Lecanosticta acicola TaxID=111012 RepID=A0AAI8Z4I5_9PEZI|nr:Hypothetical predicted protein [Lecanosticta acicola]